MREWLIELRTLCGCSQITREKHSSPPDVIRRPLLSHIPMRIDESMFEETVKGRERHFFLSHRENQCLIYIEKDD